MANIVLRLSSLISILNAIMYIIWAIAKEDKPYMLFLKKRLNPIDAYFVGTLGVNFIYDRYQSSVIIFELQSLGVIKPFFLVKT